VTGRKKDCEDPQWHKVTEATSLPSRGPDSLQSKAIPNDFENWKSPIASKCIMNRRGNELDRCGWLRKIQVGILLLPARSRVICPKERGMDSPSTLTVRAWVGCRHLHLAAAGDSGTDALLALSGTPSDRAQAPNPSWQQGDVIRLRIILTIAPIPATGHNCSQARLQSASTPPGRASP
jgi:hypothetical protein